MHISWISYAKVLFYGAYVYSYVGEVRMPIVGVPRCALKKPFSRACDASILVKKRTSELNPHSEAYCLSLYSVFSKRSPWKKYFYLLKSVQDIRRVSGVVYCWGLQICELSAIILVQLCNCSRWKRMVLTEVDIQRIVYDKNKTVTIS